MRNTLKLFTENNNLEQASGALLKKLGVKYTPIVEGIPFDSYFQQMDFSYQYVEEARQCVEHIWNIGYINDTTFQQDANNTRYESLSIFACEIKPDANFTRGLAVDLTRAFNRVSTRRVNNYYDMPVIVIMRQGSLLSIATCEHGDRKDGMGDKIGKVTILRNMNCENLHAGHRQILERIADDVVGCSSYEELHNKWFKSFSIDVLSDKFFEGYKAIYEDIIEYVTGKRMVKRGNKWEETIVNEPNQTIFAEFCVFDNPEKTIRDYVKKLMGRLVFIQFLQKKGWLGVPIDGNWGDGDREFIQHLFEKSNDKDHFVDNVLEPLFNDINTRRGNDIVSPAVGKGIRVPYLNGGLFEPDAADAVDFPLPAKFMKSMLDFFASYNFTIDENAPDDVEMGVDPEMLGRIFENLLEDNKDKGAFYTPKEIVQYMCRESLIAYLQTGISDDMQKQAIRQFVTTHKRIDNLPGEIAQKLIDVKICDPAIGSGAFPMGLLKELYLCRAALNDFNPRMKSQIKKHIIQHNIYGVDIERGAVDTARLRFWLALIVDEESPEALPNLDFKIMQGNSLLESFHGIDLSTLTEMSTKTPVFETQKNIFGEIEEPQMKVSFTSNDDFVEFKTNLTKYFEATSSNDKKELRQHISNFIKHQIAIVIDRRIQQCQSLIQELSEIEELNKKQKEGLEKAHNELEQLQTALVRIESLREQNSEFFLWHTWFYDVFSNGGFDIVIGNPPYFVYQDTHVGEIKELRSVKDYAIAFGGKLNAYKLFIAHALNVLCKDNGIMCVICQNSLLADRQATNLRKFILEHNQFISIDSFPERDSKKKRVFESVKMSVCIPIVRKQNTHYYFDVFIWDDKYKSSGIKTQFNCEEIKSMDSEEYAIPRLNKEYTPIVIKIINHKELSLKCFEGELNMTFHKKFFTSNKANPTILKGAAIQRYFVTLQMSQGEIEHLDEQQYMKEFGTSEKSKHHNFQRIAMQGMTGANDKVRLVMAIVPKGVYLANSCNYILEPDGFQVEALLGILNSKLINWYFRCFSTNSNVNGYEIENLPIPKIGLTIQNEIKELVNRICTASKVESKAFEDKINQIVYCLYGLTKEEISVIEQS
ncbi:MAG: N-6 DNA methylase [Muribaculaceae bacterium]|nr:N-6 DNA methylase [Muribaculaceae bacterium]